MQLPGVPSHSQEREAGSHALGGAGSLCMYPARRHPLCAQLPAPEGQTEGRGRGDPGVQWKQLLSGREQLWPLPGERSSQGLSFLGNGWRPGCRQAPLPSQAIHRGQVCVLDR